MITLLLNGINLKKVCYSYDIAINTLKEISRLIYFPNSSEEKVIIFLNAFSFKKIASTLVNLSYDINENVLTAINSFESVKESILNEIKQKCIKENQLFKTIIRSFIKTTF